MDGRTGWPLSIVVLALAACGSDDGSTGGDHPAADTGSSTAGQSSPYDEICQGYADHLEMCASEDHAIAFDAAQAFGYCASELSVAAGQGSACSSAREDYFACLSAIECAALEDQTLACSDEREAQAAACNGGGESTDSSSTG